MYPESRQSAGFFFLLIFERMNTTGARIRRALIVLIIVYCVGGLTLYFVQDLILFHPKPLARNYQFKFEQSFEETDIQYGKYNLSLVKFRSQKKRNGIVLFYHGNMENVEHYKKYPQIFLGNNYDVWMIDYPGFGKTTGKRSESIMDDQAMLMYDMALQQSSADSIVIYGKSIGTGVAAFVASKKKCRRLILETPYYSIRSLARHYLPVYPVSWMVKYSFSINGYLKDVKSPITIFHGTRDEVIPYSHSMRLKSENKKIELISIENGKHNDLTNFNLYHTTLDGLLQH